MEPGLGTALLARSEVVEVTSAHKQRIVDSNGEDTVYTEVFDIIEQKIFGMKWREGIASRVHLNEFAIARDFPPHQRSAPADALATTGAHVNAPAAMYATRGHAEHRPRPLHA